jgi:hypothetical protein
MINPSQRSWHYDGRLIEVTGKRLDDGKVFKLHYANGSDVAENEARLLFNFKEYFLGDNWEIISIKHNLPRTTIYVPISQRKSLNKTVQM